MNSPVILRRKKHGPVELPAPAQVPTAPERDYAAARTEFVAGRVSLSELSAKYDLPERALKRIAFAESWVEQRKTFAHATAVVAVPMTAESDGELVTVRSIVGQIITQAARRLQVALESGEASITLRDFAAVARLHADLQKPGWSSGKKGGAIVTTLDAAIDSARTNGGTIGNGVYDGDED